MENKPSETPKLIGLIVGIVLVLGIAIWRIIGAAQAPSSPTTPANPNASVASTAGSSSDTGSKSANASDTVIPGMVRALSPLDDEQTQLTPVSSVNAFKVPVEPKKQVKVATTSASHPINTGPSTNSNPGTNSGPPQVFTPQTHTETVKVEGLVTGEDGFAMLTLDDKGGNPDDKGGSKVTAFVRPGDVIRGYKIMRLGDDNVVVLPVSDKLLKDRTGKAVKPEKELWYIGREKSIDVPGAPKAPTMNAPNPSGSPLLPTISALNEGKPLRTEADTGAPRPPTQSK